MAPLVLQSAGTGYVALRKSQCWTDLDLGACWGILEATEFDN
jgi:hypothetical protein